MVWFDLESRTLRQKGKFLFNRNGIFGKRRGAVVILEKCQAASGKLRFYKVLDDSFLVLDRYVVLLHLIIPSHELLSNLRFPSKWDMNHMQLCKSNKYSIKICTVLSIVYDILIYHYCLIGRYTYQGKGGYKKQTFKGQFAAVFKGVKCHLEIGTDRFLRYCRAVCGFRAAKSGAYLSVVHFLWYGAASSPDQ